jgi:hypothetical protein
MNAFRLMISFFVFPSFFAGCASGDFDQSTLYKQEAGNGYCHMKLKPVGPTDVARLTQSRAGDYIDYSGSCGGPSIAEQLRKQRRFEQFRFGRDYMPG